MMLLNFLLAKGTLGLIINCLTLITDNNMLTIKKHGISNISIADDAEFAFSQIRLSRLEYFYRRVPSLA